MPLFTAYKPNPTLNFKFNFSNKRSLYPSRVCGLQNIFSAIVNRIMMFKNIIRTLENASSNFFYSTI